MDVKLLNPTNDSIEFSVLSGIKIPEGVDVSFDKMNAQFYRLETKDQPIPFATVDIPRLEFSGNERFTLANHTMRLGDTDQFAAMVEEAVHRAMFDVAAQANTNIRFAGPSRRIEVDKVASMPGIFPPT